MPNKDNLPKYAIICMTCKKTTGYDFITTTDAEVEARHHIDTAENVISGISQTLILHKVLVAYLVK